MGLCPLPEQHRLHLPSLILSSRVCLRFTFFRHKPSRSELSSRDRRFVHRSASKLQLHPSPWFTRFSYFFSCSPWGTPSTHHSPRPPSSMAWYAVTLFRLPVDVPSTHSKASRTLNLQSVIGGSRFVSFIRVVSVSKTVFKLNLNNVIYYTWVVLLYIRYQYSFIIWLYNKLMAPLPPTLTHTTYPTLYLCSYP